MCGIAGFSISDKDHRHIDCRTLAKNLARQIERRGRDATGIAWSETTEDGVGVWYMKDHEPATSFLHSIDQIPRHTRTAIIHTRYATKGSPQNNDNNHPIVVGHTVGIHNGSIRNDDEIIEMVGTGRTGQVDTEAIFRLIDVSDRSRPFENLGLINGTAALAWFDVDDPSSLHLCRVCGSPLFVATTEGGSKVFASLDYMVATACRQSGVKVDKIKEIGEGLYMKIQHGKVTDVSYVLAPAGMLA